MNNANCLTVVTNSIKETQNNSKRLSGNNGISKN